MTAEMCRKLLDAPSLETPIGIRDRAIIGMFAYTACKLSELIGMNVGDYKKKEESQIAIRRTVNTERERLVGLHEEATGRLEEWIDVADIGSDKNGPLFRPSEHFRHVHKGFIRKRMSRVPLLLMLKKYGGETGVPNITSQMFRVSALQMAMKQNIDLLTLQEFAGHADVDSTESYVKDSARRESPSKKIQY